MNVKQLKELLNRVDDNAELMACDPYSDDNYSPIGFLWHTCENALFVGGKGWDGRGFGNSIKAILPSLSFSELDIRGQMKALDWYLSEWDIGNECTTVDDAIYSLNEGDFKFNYDGSYIED